MPVNQLPVTLIKLRTMTLITLRYIKVIYVMYDKLVSAKRSMQVGGERERGPSTKQLVSLLNFVLQPSLTVQSLTLPNLSYTINRYIVHCSVLWTKYKTIGIHTELCPITSFDQLHLYLYKKRHF